MEKNWLRVWCGTEKNAVHCVLLDTIWLVYVELSNVLFIVQSARESNSTAKTNVWLFFIRWIL